MAAWRAYIIQPARICEEIVRPRRRSRGRDDDERGGRGAVRDGGSDRTGRGGGADRRGGGRSADRRGGVRAASGGGGDRPRSSPVSSVRFCSPSPSGVPPRCRFGGRRVPLRCSDPTIIASGAARFSQAAPSSSAAGSHASPRRPVARRQPSSAVHLARQARAARHGRPEPQ